MKVILDECVANRRLRRYMRENGTYDVLLWKDLKYDSAIHGGDKDAFLISEGKRLGYFVVTVDFKTITINKFPPCRDNSILQLGESGLSADYMFERLEAFRTLFLEHRAVGHYTYLNNDGIEIITHKEPIERKFNEHPETRHITLKI